MRESRGRGDGGSELMLSGWIHRTELVQGGKKGRASYAGAQCQSGHEHNSRWEGRPVRPA